MRRLAALAAMLAAGCVTVDVQTPGEPLPPEVLRARIEVRQYADEFAQRVAHAADAMPAAARSDALRWKIGASSASRVAAYRFHAHLALVDTWALAVQMERFFAEGAGRGAFGAAQPQALATARALRAQADVLAARRLEASTLEGYRQVVAEYAAAEPLRDLSFGRAPIALRWREAAARLGTALNTAAREPRLTVDVTGAAVTGAAAASEAAARVDRSLSTVGSAAEVAADASARLDVYGQRVPDELRWRTELVLAESGLQSADLQRTLGGIEAELARLGELARTQPELAMQRLAELQAELARVARDFDGRWEQTLATLQVERAAVMRDLEAMRAALDATIARERKAIVADAGALGKELLPLVVAELRGLVGQALALVIALTLILLLLPFAAGYLLGRARRK